MEPSPLRYCCGVHSIGNGADPKTDVGPVINADAVEKIMSYIRIGRNDDGSKLAWGGKRLTRGDYANGHFIGFGKCCFIAFVSPS